MCWAVDGTMAGLQTFAGVMGCGVCGTWVWAEGLHAVGPYALLVVVFGVYLTDPMPDSAFEGSSGRPAKFLFFTSRDVSGDVDVSRVVFGVRLTDPMPDSAFVNISGRLAKFLFFTSLRVA